MTNQFQLERKLFIQMQREWNLFNDIDWTAGVDLDRYLLPLNDEIRHFARQAGVSPLPVSWMFGLLAASAISEHERVLNDLKDTWKTSLENRKQVPGLYQLGEQFFKEELKHSEAFRRFLETAAIFLNLKYEELKSFLPVYEENSWIAKLYKRDALKGGNALWWTVAATEEESIELFRMISKNEAFIDPLFFQINKLHYEEEIRHSSFSYMMIDLHAGNRKLSNASSYLLSRSLQLMWIHHQLARLNEITKYAHRHPYLQEMSRFVAAINSMPLHKKIRFFYKDSGYIAMMLRPENHVRIRRRLLKICHFPKTGESI